MRLGRPFPADVLVRGAAGNRRVVMDAIGLAVAELVPVAYRGFYGDAGRFPAAVDALRNSRA